MMSVFQSRSDENKDPPMITAILSLLSSAAFIWSILEVFTVTQQRPGISIPDAVRVAAGKYGINF